MTSHRLNLRAKAVPILSDAAARVRAADFPLHAQRAEEGSQLQRALGTQISEYLLPRLRDPDAPLLVVVGGSTGSGKSTLVNSIVGEELTESGVIRPTTVWPVLVHHPEDRSYFASDRILPHLQRTRDGGEGAKSQQKLRLVASTAVPRGLAIIDSPDIDSVRDSNRELSRQLLSAADLWLFVTTAVRYSDAVPWDLLHQADERGTSVAVVLNRVPPQANREVRHHLAQLLAEAGHGSAPIFTVPELKLEDDLIPEAAVFPLKSWVENLGRSPRARTAVLERTLQGALASVRPQTEVLADCAEEQVRAYRELQEAAEGSFGAAGRRLGEALVADKVLRGEVQARWQDFVGTGQFFRGLEPTVSRLRDRITSAVTGRRDSADLLIQAILSSIVVLVREQAVRASGSTVDTWQELPHGRPVVERHPGLGSLPAGFDQLCRQRAAEWAASVEDTVRSVGQTKTAKARIMSFGVAGVSGVLMYAVCAGAGGTGAPRTGSAEYEDRLAVHRLLNTIFGPEATEELAASARRRLLDTGLSLLSRAREPFEDALASVAVSGTQADDLRATVRRLEGLT